MGHHKPGLRSRTNSINYENTPGTRLRLGNNNGDYCCHFNNRIYYDMKYFAIIGAQRSATTTLYHYLNEHPLIEMVQPVAPEPRLFLRTGKDNPGVRITVPRSGWVGEKSVAYMDYPHVARGIKQRFSDAKILAILRNPVERAVSHYWYSVRGGLEKRDITQAMSEQGERQEWTTSMNPFNYIDRGRYYYDLKPYLDAFGENMMMFTTEDFLGKKDTRDEIWKFFDLPPIDFKLSHKQKGDYPATDKKVLKYLKDQYKEDNEKLLQWGIHWK